MLAVVAVQSRRLYPIAGKPSCTQGIKMKFALSLIVFASFLSASWCQSALLQELPSCAVSLHELIHKPPPRTDRI